MANHDSQTTWTAPSHLPDLRRVDNNLVAIDTETNDEGLRADRGSGWPWHGGWICGISVAWREGRRDPRDLHPDAPSRQRQFRSRHCRPLAQGPHRRRRALHHPERTLRLGLAARRWRHPDAAVRPARRDRRAGDPDRREPLRLQPRRALRLARTARQGHDAVGRGGQGCRLQDQQEDPAAVVHLATAGALCRPLRRSAIRSPR